jgi:PmbA protein
MDYLDLADQTVRKSVTRGADQCDCLIETGRELTIKVRRGKVESIERANFTGLGLRFIRQGRLGFGYTTDLSPGAIEDLIERSRAFAEAATADPDGGIPEPVPIEPADLETYDSALEDVSLEEKISRALSCEQAAYDHDPRIKFTYGTSYTDAGGRVILARTGTDPLTHRGTRCDLSCVPVAEESGGRRLGFWVSTERFYSDLEPPQVVGVAAAQRAIAMLGARPVKTQKASVVFDQRTGAEVVGEIFNGLDGENTVKGMSFLKNRLGRSVGSEPATFVDDGRMPRRLGSRPFDSEGIPTGRVLAIDRGRLKSYLYDSRSARKAGAASTGNARRSFASIPSVGPNNFYLVPGKQSREELIAGVTRGVMITNLLGFGVNVTTGDYSRGAEGLWIEDGKVVHPVDGITVAGNLLEMLEGLTAVASDLRFYGRLGSPTFQVEGMTIAGD